MYPNCPEYTLDSRSFWKNVTLRTRNPIELFNVKEDAWTHMTERTKNYPLDLETFISFFDKYFISWFLQINQLLLSCAILCLHKTFICLDFERHWLKFVLLSLIETKHICTITQEKTVAQCNIFFWFWTRLGHYVTRFLHPDYLNKWKLVRFSLSRLLFSFLSHDTKQIWHIIVHCSL